MRAGSNGGSGWDVGVVHEHDWGSRSSPFHITDAWVARKGAGPGPVWADFQAGFGLVGADCQAGFGLVGADFPAGFGQDGAGSRAGFGRDADHRPLRADSASAAA